MVTERMREIRRRRKRREKARKRRMREMMQSTAEKMKQPDAKKAQS